MGSDAARAWTGAWGASLSVITLSLHTCSLLPLQTINSSMDQKLRASLWKEADLKKMLNDKKPSLVQFPGLDSTVTDGSSSALQCHNKDKWKLGKRSLYNSPAVVRALRTTGQAAGLRERQLLVNRYALSL